METYDFSTNGTSGNGGGSSSASTMDAYGMPATPDWLKSDVASKPLQNELANTDKYYDVSKYLKAMNAAAQSQFGMDLQEGQYAASEAGARAIQNGTVGAVNTSQVAASTALPGMQNALNTKAQAADIALKAGIANAQGRASIAQAIADSRAKYSSVLANYISTTRGQTITGMNTSRSLDIQQAGNDNQLQGLYASLVTSKDASPEVRAWAKSKLGIGQFSPGYVSNVGQIVGTNQPAATGMNGPQVPGIY